LLSQYLLTESNPKEAEAETGATQPGFRLAPYSEGGGIIIDEHLNIFLLPNPYLISRSEEYEN